LRNGGAGTDNAHHSTGVIRVNWNKCSVAAVLVLVVAFAGCGRGPRLVEVKGTITLDGKPLEGAAVQFVYTDYPQTAKGLTDASGNFSMVYYNRSGAPLGPCKIVIRKQGPAPDGSGALMELIPPKYNANSQELVEITKSGPNEFKFDIRSDEGGNISQSNAQQPAEEDSPEPSEDEERAPQQGSEPSDERDGREESDDG
jgi:hypothetical protein